MPHVLLATDADWLVDQVTAALGGPDTSFTVVREGRLVCKVVGERQPDLAILDLQVGSMGGMAVTMDLRHDESVGVYGHVPVLMLLDRIADVHLAKRSGAEGWIVKPLDALRLRRAADTVLAGGTYAEGLDGTPADAIDEPADEPAPEPDDEEVTEVAEAPEEEPTPAG